MLKVFKRFPSTPTTARTVRARQQQRRRVNVQLRAVLGGLAAFHGMRNKLRLIFLLRSAFFGPRFTARKDHQLVIHSATGILCLDQNRCDGGSGQGFWWE